MKHWFSAIVAIFLCLAPASPATPVPERDVLAAVSAWLGQNAVFRQFAPNAAVAAVAVPDDGPALAALAIVRLHPRGYVIMSTDDTLPPVVAFSETASLTHGLAPGSPLADLLQAQNRRFADLLAQPQTRSATDYFAQNRGQWDRLRATDQTRAAPIDPVPSTILQPPLLSTFWGQHAPYDHYLPTSGNTTLIRADAGCVPVAIAQILKFHHWPPRGQGGKSHADSEGATRATLAANLSLPFAWDAMQDAYAGAGGAGGAPTAPANLAVARACLALGVFFDSDYELNGTGTFSNDIPKVFSNHLFFHSSDFKMSNISSHYSNYISPAALYANIKNDILAGRPAYVGFSGMTNIGNHSFVADGLLTDSGADYYHFNYGWDGYENGWYRLNDGYENTVISNGITGIQPQLTPQFTETAYEQPPDFTLSWQFPDYHAAAVTAFRLRTTRNGITTTISSNIPPGARSWNLANQPAGEAKYTLAALMNGAWQPAATVTVTVTPAPAVLQMTVLTPVVTGFNTSPFTVEINVSDLPGLNLNAATSRPDLFPTANLTFSGQGLSQTLTLTPATTARTGNVLVWITATAANGKWQTTATADLVVKFPEVPLAGAGAAVNSPGQDFFTDGHANWRVQAATAFSPPAALQSGGGQDAPDGSPILYDNDFSRLYTYVTGPCAVAFQWKVSSQPETEEYPDADYLIFAVDDVEIGRIAGDLDWEYYAVVIPEPGTYTLSWTYQKGDGPWFMYDDCGWLDDFSCVPLYPVTVTAGAAASASENPAATILAAAGDIVTLTASPTAGGARFRRWETAPAVNLADAGNAETTFSMPAAPVAATALFEADIEITLAPGWNLVGLPVTLEAADAIPLAGLPAFSCQLLAGQPHYAKTTIFPGGQAYWLFHDDADALTLPLTGLTTTVELPTAPGWHLVAPVVATPIPNHAEAWRWNGKTYAVVADAVVTPLEACWLYIHP